MSHDEELLRLERAETAGGLTALEAARMASLRERAGLAPAGKPLHGLVLVLAGRGAGKTTLLKGIIERHRRKGHRFLVWDYLGKFLPRPGVKVLRNCEPEEAAAEAIKLAPITLVLDEVDVGIPSTEPLKKGSALLEILMYGRQAKAGEPWARKGPVALLGSARRAHDVHPRFRSLSDVLFLGRMMDPSDLKWVEKVTDRGTALSLPKLTTGNFVRRDCT